MDVRRFGFQSWDDGTRLYRASRGPAILPHPLLRLEPCRCWCGAGANQPNPTHRTHSPSPAPPRLNRPPSASCSFALHFLFLHLLFAVSCSSWSSSFSTSSYYYNCYYYYYYYCRRCSAVTPLPPTATYRRPLPPPTASRPLASVLRPPKPPPPLPGRLTLYRAQLPLKQRTHARIHLAFSSSSSMSSALSS